MKNMKTQNILIKTRKAALSLRALLIILITVFGLIILTLLVTTVLRAFK
ncbi:hypothetical protein GF371_00385 [Candidatus Woesearchaeota archaeon]|nr:hypothetical protein [Candidatus Woesearchaeota archaeon]